MWCNPSSAGFATILRHPFSGRATLAYKEQQSALRSGDLHETAIVMRVFAKKIALIGVPFMVLLGPPR